MGQDMNSMLTGLSNSLNSYLGMSIKNNIEQQQETHKSQLETAKDKNVAQYKSGLDLNKEQALELYKQSITGKIDPKTAASLSPKHAELVENFNKLNGRYPTVPEADKMFDDINKEADKGKQQKSDDVRITQWDRLLSSDREFTLSRTTRNNLEKMGALLDQAESQKGGADKRQMYEQAVGQMRVLAQNGQIAEKEIEHLLPESYKGNLLGWLEKVKNEPMGTDQQEFLHRSRDFFNREAKVTKEQMSRRFDELSDPYVDILSRNPNPASKTYKRYGVTHEIFNPGTDTAPKAKQGKGSDPLGLGI